MNRLQYLLTKLAEELIEAGKEALKAQQFGLDNQYHGETNRERINKELMNVEAIKKMLNDEFSLGFEVKSIDLQAHIEKVNKNYHISIEKGYVI